MVNPRNDSSAMSSTQPTSWELRLNAWQSFSFAVVMGLALFVSYYFGILAGQQVGFESARSVTTFDSPKLLIPETSPEQSPDAGLDIYARLSSPRTTETKEIEPLPELGGVEENKVEENSVQENRVQDSSSTNSIESASKTEATEQIEMAGASEVEPKAADAIKVAALPPPSDKQQELPAVPAEEPEQQVIEQLVQEPKPEQKVVLKQTGAAEKLEKKEEAISIASKTTEVAPLEHKRADTQVGEPSEKVTSVLSNPPIEYANSQASTQSIAQSQQRARLGQPTKRVRSISAGWYVQVAAPAREVDAHRLRATLRSSGFRSVIQQSKLGSQNSYRVLVGPEENRQHANILVKQLERERYLKGQPFLKWIGSGN